MRQSIRYLLPFFDKAIGQFCRRQFHKDRILPETLDPAPWNSIMFRASESEKATVPRDTNGTHASVICIQFDRRRCSETGSVAKIDNFHFLQFGRGDLSHIRICLSCPLYRRGNSYYHHMRLPAGACQTGPCVLREAKRKDLFVFMDGSGQRRN